MQKEKAFIYIDTNFSNDEALMLDMAFRSFNFELVGLSSIRSQMTAEAGADNILGLNEDHELFLPIARGHEKNLKEDQMATKGESIFHYKNHRDYLEEVDVEDQIYDIAHDCGKIDILATGPLTNIARALDKYEDLEDYISHIFISGGNLYGPDFNFKEDPQAINKILNSSIDIFILAKNLADGIELTDSFLEGLPKDDKNKEIIDNLLADKDKRFLYGPLLLYLVEKPEAFIFEETGIKVDDKENIGEMIRVNSRRKVYLANRVNEESFLEYIEGKLCK
ncbi:MAG: nucleoside hydrolase [Anaerococcus sp.]|uniref:nucleoside hydrolase n=1 Tax=Anaerococcus sp. TaxID=1872515 RepID=UPI002605A7F2|nr:nucleoside hydrolase [Anaerococcus sp.]MCI5971812.1 nucleoside hydrolase [Anaerococcus sp.]